LRPWITDGDTGSRDEALRIYAEAREARDARGDTDHPEVWWRLDRALETITAARPWSAFPKLDEDVESGVSASSFNPGGGGAAGVPGPSPELRLAVQATLAVALAVVAGRLISGERWYWAVLAAFVVFVRAATVGETFSRAWQRMLGTLAGVAIGLIVARLVGHHPWPASAVGLVAIFLAYYLMRISYTGMIACFTIALALLYEEMGRAPASLMVLRLAETFAGAAIGVLVSALVLPVRSETRVRALAAGVLRSATPALERATQPGVDAESDVQLHDEIRNVDRALAELRGALRPLWGPNVPVERTDVTRQGRISAALAYATRRLSTVSLSDVGGRGALLREIGARMTENFRVVADGLEQGRGVRVEPVDAMLARLQRMSGGEDDNGAREASAEGDRQTVSLLADMDVIVRELAEGVASSRG
ncbi:MAG: FUSC family protein, partial [Gemmatimonadetes bacterium]|nr:FUSC family protein [Gemmatimonadota bacterium]